ncbi:MAG TPA: cytochrome c [Phenylobacterium sp.]|nr:cytochrome c [Phenylobacterium sp.]
MPRDLGLPSLLAAVLSVALSACASTPPKPVSPAARGHDLAQRACSACHAVEPGGTSPRGAAPAFGSLEMRHTAGLEGRVADLARQGHYGMPPVQLSSEDARDLVAYIQSLGAP